MWEGQAWVCGLKWIRAYIFQHEEVSISRLLFVVMDFIPSFQFEKWWWRHSKIDSYFVASVYLFLLTCDFPRGREILLVELILSTGICCMTRIQLKGTYSRVGSPLVRGAYFLFYFGTLESSSHIFLAYGVVVFVWYMIFIMLGWYVVLL